MNGSLARALAGPLRAALKSAPVVVVTGARQTGKSTLVQAIGPKRNYLTLDDHAIEAQARTEPDSLLRGNTPLTLDEIQRTPGLLAAIKRAVDKKRTPGRFLLTGSANLLLMRQVSESLAGRAIYLTLWPMTRRELLGEGRSGSWSQLFDHDADDWIDVLARAGERADWQAAIRRGGYPVPAAHLRTAADRALWFTGYTRTYLERDLLELSSVSSLIDFRRLMQVCAHRTGRLINQTDLGRDAGLPQATVHRWLNLLEASYQLIRVPAFAQNRTKRLIKSPKLYWADTAHLLHLAQDSKLDGFHLENLVCQDLLVWSELEVARPPQLMYWRTAVGDDVAFVIEWRDRLLPIEVKTTASPQPDDCKGLSVFLREYGRRCPAGLLLHTGNDLRWMADGVLAVPWWRLM